MILNNFKNPYTGVGNDRSMREKIHKNLIASPVKKKQYTYGTNEIEYYSRIHN